MIRELAYPVVAVVADHDAQDIAVTFNVPGSKFGSLRVVLTFADAQALAADLLEHVEAGAR